MKEGSHLDEHLMEARVEDALFLMSPAGGGLLLEQAAARLGVTTNTLTKNLERHREDVSS